MSQDYYLVCKKKKIYMPIFSMNGGMIGLSDKRWIFDFLLKCAGSEIKFVTNDFVSFGSDHRDFCHHFSAYPSRFT